LASEQNKGKVLVLGGDTRSFLAVVRSLGRKGLIVHAAWAPRDSVALTSRFISEVHGVRFPSAPLEEWKPQFIELLERERYDLVIPTNDQCILPLQRLRGEFVDRSPIYLISDEAFEISRDKIRSCEIAAVLDIPLPRFEVAKSKADWQRIAQEFSFPVVVKPRSSFVEKDLHSKNHVWKARDSSDFLARLDGAIAEDGVLVQEHFSGIGAGVEILAAQGKILFAFQHERVHEPLHGGGSTYRRSVELHPELFEATCRYVEALEYTGVAMFEYRINPQTGKWIFVEINSRFWGSLPLAVAAGADFPRFLYEMLVEGRRDFSSTYHRPIYARNLITDLRWIWTNLRADKSDPMLNTKPNLEVFLEARHLFCLREHWDTLTLDDPRPGLIELREYLGKIGHKLSRRLRSYFYAWTPQRRHQQGQIRTRLKTASEVLFVCKGNICRSPFAEFLARELFPARIRFSSAGLLPQTGRSSPTQAGQSARLYGVDLKAHSSKTVTGELIDRANLILVFDLDNLTQLRQRYPQVAERAFLLGVLGTDPRIEIDDPFGGDAEDFDRAYAKISAQIKELGRDLV